jgi:phosphatidate cytidylyltransferase
MKNLITRTLTGAVFITIIITGTVWNFWSYIFLFSFIALFGLWEFYALLNARMNSFQKIAGTIFGMLLLLASVGKYFLPVSTALFSNGFFIIILLFPFYLVFSLFRSSADVLKKFSPWLFGILYVILPFCYLIIAYSQSSSWNTENNKFVILGFFFLIWANDTFAYLTGWTMGKIKLFERISPKKTWEGFIGGIVFTQLLAAIFAVHVPEFPSLHWHVLGLIVSVSGTLGDLAESMLKRNLGVKDSGNILPGHGGILDRFDAALLAAPFAVAYILFTHLTQR